MAAFALLAGLSGFEFVGLASLCFVLIAPVILVVVLERRVFRNGADPVGLEEIERESDNPDAWIED